MHGLLSLAAAAAVALALYGAVPVSGANVTDCTSLKDCGLCSLNTDCVWCTTSHLPSWKTKDGSTNAVGKCLSPVDTNHSYCRGGQCQGKACELVCEEPCTNEIWPCSNQWFGELLLIVFFGVILAVGAKVISDGSELLLDLFPNWASVIGGLFLPVLGAVPDAAIIVVSGALGTKAMAQEQVNVGMGTLAGSTIMLLTITWSASMFVARCDLNEFGQARDQVCNGVSLTRQGVTVDDDTPTNSIIMLITSLAYLIVQGVAFAFLKKEGTPKAINTEHYPSLVGMIVCLCLLVAYCVYQLMVPKLAAKRAEKHEKEMDDRRQLLRAMAVVEKWSAASKTMAAKRAAEPADPQATEAQARGLGVMWRARAAAAKAAREGGDDDSDAASTDRSPLLAAAASAGTVNAAQDSDDDDDDDDEIDPEEIQANFGKYLAQSIIMMLGGTAVVAVFSDPMVSAITSFANTANIPAFYISFIVTPFCSNASEFVSSLAFAAKKKKNNTSLTFSQIYGAASMNATMCLGIFYALVFFRGLAWQFSAEVITILFVVLLVGAATCRATTFKLFWGIPVLALYPGSIFLVYALETWVGIN